MNTQKQVLRSLVILAIGLGGAAPLTAQPAPQSPYGLALSHMLSEHLADLDVAIVFDRFPRIDLAMEAAESRGLRAAPHHELVACDEGKVGLQCRFAVDADVLLSLVSEERAPREMQLTFFMAQEVFGRMSGGQRILTLNRIENEWVIVNDQPGIRF